MGCWRLGSITVNFATPKIKLALADFLIQLDANNGFSDFFKTLVEETYHFPNQVRLDHGDSQNFSQVDVFGGLENSWVEMTVAPSLAHVFSFKPVVLIAAQ